MISTTNKKGVMLKSKLEQNTEHDNLWANWQTMQDSWKVQVIQTSSIS